MSATSPTSREFFEQYAQSRSSLDIGLIASQYTDSFMVAGPNGARVMDKAAVVAAFPRAQQFLKTLGHKSTKVQSLDETRLDDHYLLARVQLEWRFEKASEQPIDVQVDATFILYEDLGGFTIVFQHEHEEFQEALRAKGLLPE